MVPLCSDEAVQQGMTLKLLKERQRSSLRKTYQTVHFFFIYANEKQSALVRQNEHLLGARLRVVSMWVVAFQGGSYYCRVVGRSPQNSG